jgi:hypothetical protein
MTTKGMRAHYTEKEAAQALGVSVEQLRLLIRSHIIDGDEDLSNVAAASSQPSDLLLLKILSGQELVPVLQD